MSSSTSLRKHKKRQEQRVVIIRERTSPRSERRSPRHTLSLPESVVPGAAASSSVTSPQADDEESFGTSPEFEPDDPDSPRPPTSDMDVEKSGRGTKTVKFIGKTHHDYSAERSRRRVMEAAVGCACHTLVFSFLSC